MKLTDPFSERTVLGTILKNGKDSLIDADAVLCATDFENQYNRHIYSSLHELGEDKNCHTLDKDTIKLKLKQMGFLNQANDKKYDEYLDILPAASVDKMNLDLFSLQVKKYSVARGLYDSYQSAIKYLENISGNETLSEIIEKSEDKIVDAIKGIENEDGLVDVSQKIEKYIQEKIEEEEVDQVGIPTGFTLWDDWIGGGLRGSTVNVTIARSKVGKSFLAMNATINIASQGIPVLYLDTELVEKVQLDRMIPIVSNCPIYAFETKQFKRDKEHFKNVVDAGKLIKEMPIHYQSIAGMDHNEALALVRRWIVKRVGFNEVGKANPCVVIYDYLKLTGGALDNQNIKEYMALGIMLTLIQDFAIKYDIPFYGLVQANRDGIDGEDTSIIAGSDRILWLCSSMSLLKNKTATDEEMGCGMNFGNKKLIVMATRYGSGTPVDGDYINIKASLNPGVDKLVGTGAMKEGLSFSSIARQ